MSENARQELQHGLAFAGSAEIEGCGHQPHLTHPEVQAEIARQFFLPFTFSDPETPRER